MKRLTLDIKQVKTATDLETISSVIELSIEEENWLISDADYLMLGLKHSNFDTVYKVTDEKD